jgi:hypothetical protein
MTGIRERRLSTSAGPLTTRSCGALSTTGMQRIGDFGYRHRRERFVDHAQSVTAPDDRPDGRGFHGGNHVAELAAVGRGHRVVERGRGFRRGLVRSRCGIALEARDRTPPELADEAVRVLQKLGDPVRIERAHLLPGSLRGIMERLSICELNLQFNRQGVEESVVAGRPRSKLLYRWFERRRGRASDAAVSRLRAAPSTAPGLVHGLPEGRSA